MKKLLALILALTMLVAVFAACGEKDTPTTASTTEATTTTTEKTTAPKEFCWNRYLKAWQNTIPPR